MVVNGKDLWAGIAFVGVAALYGGTAYRSLPIGQALNMGPGYFPVLLAGLLVLVGAVLIVRSLGAAEQVRAFASIPWRPIAAVCLAILFFGAFVREVGMFPAVFVTAFVCSMASARVRLMHAAVVALCLAALCTAIFSYGLRVPIPVLGTWLTG